MCSAAGLPISLINPSNIINSLTSNNTSSNEPYNFNQNLETEKDSLAVQRRNIDQNNANLALEQGVAASQQQMLGTDANISQKQAQYAASGILTNDGAAASQLAGMAQLGQLQANTTYQKAQQQNYMDQWNGYQQAAALSLSQQQQQQQYLHQTTAPTLLSGACKTLLPLLFKGLSMTIMSSNSSVTYQGNGSTTTFNFDFMVDNAICLQVWLTDNTQTPPLTTMLDPKLYLTSGLGSPKGGTVTYTQDGAPLASGMNITINRVVPYIQPMSFNNQNGVYPEMIERALDYLTAQTQQLAAGLNQAIIIPSGDASTPSQYLATIRQVLQSVTSLKTLNNQLIALLSNLPTDSRLLLGSWLISPTAPELNPNFGLKSFHGVFWLNSSNNSLMLRDPSDQNWISIGVFNPSLNSFVPSDNANVTRWVQSPTAPNPADLTSNTLQGVFWLNTANNNLMVRDPYNQNWVSMGSFDTAYNTFIPSLPLSGTSPNNLVKLDSKARLPAVDASQLRNLPPPLPQAAYRNRIINSNFAVNQYTTAALLPAASTYMLDRWCFESTQVSKISWALGGVLSNAPQSLKLTTSTAYTQAAGDKFLLKQALEGSVMADLQWGLNQNNSLTLSFIAQAAVIGKYSVTLQNYAKTISYNSLITIGAVNTPTLFTITIPPPPLGSAWASDLTGWGWLIFDLGSGSTFTTANDSIWQTGNFTNISGQINAINTASCTFQLSNVQIEFGSVATPFEYLPYDIQLLRCRRYYQTGMTTSYNAAANGQFAYFSPVMRIAPSVAIAVGVVNSTRIDGFFGQGGAANAGYTYTASAEL